MVAVNNGLYAPVMVCATTIKNLQFKGVLRPLMRLILTDNTTGYKKMKNSEKFAMQCEIDILKNALSDICFILSEIEGFEDDSCQAVLARCAYSRGQSALRNTNGSN